jgi:putative ABC transport system permease protein
VLRHRRRSVSGSAAIAVGIVALIIAAGFIEWIYVAMRDDTIHSGLGHLQIVRSGYPERGMIDPFSYLLSAKSADRELVAASPHVVQVAPRLKFSGLMGLNDASLSFLGEGRDPDRELGKDTIVIESGVALSNTAPKSVIVGQGLANNLGAKVGDTVVLLLTRQDGGLGGVEVTIGGIFSTPAKAYDDVAIHLPFILANEILQADGAHAWVVYLDQTRNTRAVAQRLAAKLGADVQVIPWYEAADFYHKTVRLFSRQVLVMKIIIALVVILAISNTMMMAVMERISEIGTAMALGVRRARMLSRFLAEGLFIGMIGGGVGLVLGYSLAAAISKVGIPMPPPPGMARGFVGQILLTPGLVFDALLLSVVTALIASAYPAWKASRMIIADALRHGH